MTYQEYAAVACPEGCGKGQSLIGVRHVVPSGGFGWEPLGVCKALSPLAWGEQQSSEVERLKALLGANVELCGPNGRLVNFTLQTVLFHQNLQRDHLRTEVERLTRELSEWRKLGAETPHAMGLILEISLDAHKDQTAEVERLVREIDQLRARIVELEKDQERLDWLDQQPGPDFKWWLQRLDSGGSIPGTIRDGYYTIRDGYYTHDKKYNSVRDAIDAARSVNTRSQNL